MDPNNFEDPNNFGGPKNFGTLVSGFININNKNVDKYIINGAKLIQHNINKIIYIEYDFYNKYLKDIEYNKENTQFRFYNKDEIYLYKYINKINIDNIIRNKEKDTIEYMMIQCNKTEWLRLAIAENYYKTNNFVWIDFGIYHVLKEPFPSFNFKSWNKIRIAGGIYRGSNIYNSICWFFLGGIIGGDKDKLLFFADKVKEKCIDIINNNGILLWEINIWYLVYLQYPDLFDVYKADHNNSMIELY